MVVKQRAGRGWVWAVAGGVVVLGAGVILAVGLLSPDDPAATPAASDTGSPRPTASGATVPPPTGDVVDASVAAKGWVPEPITRDPEMYAAAALAAAGSFDTTASEYGGWVSYLETWFTPDTRYVNERDRDDELGAAKLELRQSVVQPEEAWDALAAESGAVTATASGDITQSPVEGASDQSIWTGDVTLTFQRSAPSGETTSYEERTRVSVQVLCGSETVPTPGSAQAPGDCKVVRFFAEPIGD